MSHDKVLQSKPAETFVRKAALDPLLLLMMRLLWLTCLICGQRPVQASQCFVKCPSRRRLADEGGTKCTGVCTLGKVRTVFPTQMLEIDVLFAERWLYLDLICGR